jgi:hypothetical protein
VWCFSESYQFTGKEVSRLLGCLSAQRVLPWKEQEIERIVKTMSLSASPCQSCSQEETSLVVGMHFAKPICIGGGVSTLRICDLNDFYVYTGAVPLTPNSGQM